MHVVLHWQAPWSPPAGLNELPDSITNWCQCVLAGQLKMLEDLVSTKLGDPGIHFLSLTATPVVLHCSLTGLECGLNADGTVVGCTR